ncbi:MAG TPA: glutamate racemase [Clostridiales bacterium]|nr:glutamate racemase [Clostridiales bacterium]
MSSKAPIGVFDSGVGGLTVAKEIIKQIPNEDIIYFGDTARVPYGNKSKDTIINYTRQIVRFLMSKDVKAIVIACNTASAFALDIIKNEIDIPIIGVVNPGAKVAVSTTRNGNVGIIGTQGTIDSNVYSKYIGKLDAKIKVYGRACPLLVPLIEENLLDDPVTKEMARRYTEELLVYNIDTLVLGCTHYPLIKDTISQVVGGEVSLINPAYETAKTIIEVLKENDLLNEFNKYNNHKFYVSDGSEKFKTFAKSILSCEVFETKTVDIEKY